MRLQKATAETKAKTRGMLDKSAAEQILSVCEEALVWFTSGGGKPCLVQDTQKPLKQGHAHGRLSQCWCAIQHARGTPKSAALKAFAEDIWPTVKASQELELQQASSTM